MPEYRLPISAVNDWVTCEAMALHQPRTQGRLAVAAYVGILAHWMMDRDRFPEPHRPARLSFDRLTPHIDHARIQAAAIADAARQTLNSNGWQIVNVEGSVISPDTTGVYDLLCWHPGVEAHAIIDLKTGRLPAGVWLQVGGYLDNFHNRAELGGVLHAHRVAVNRDPVAVLDLRAASELRDTWSQRRNRILAVLDGAPPFPTPGPHCDRCTLTGCPVSVA